MVESPSYLKEARTGPVLHGLILSKTSQESSFAYCLLEGRNGPVYHGLSISNKSGLVRFSTVSYSLKEVRTAPIWYMASSYVKEVRTGPVWYGGRQVTVSEQ